METAESSPEFPHRQLGRNETSCEDTGTACVQSVAKTSADVTASNHPAERCGWMLTRETASTAPQVPQPRRKCLNRATTAATSTGTGRPEDRHSRTRFWVEVAGSIAPLEGPLVGH